MTDDPRPDTADDHDVATYPGGAIVNAAFAGTGLEAAAGLIGAIAPDRFGGLTAVVSGALFAVGVVAFLYGYAVGVVRSAEERVTIAGLFFLSGTAPPVVRHRLRGALAAQVVIAAVVGAVRAYTSVAFIVLVPMLGLGLMAAWGARHGTFFAKDDEPPTRASGEDRESQ